MNTKTFSSLAVAAAFAGAVAIAGSPQLAEASKVKCYGISKAGQNDCANAAGTHSCAGQSTVDYFGGDWKTASSADACMADGGKLEAFEGLNPAKG
ncbi:MAG: DUF2282 domain-containing protein [Pseudomonadota bacterium]